MILMCPKFYGSVWQILIIRLYSHSYYQFWLPYVATGNKKAISLKWQWLTIYCNVHGHREQMLLNCLHKMNYFFQCCTTSWLIMRHFSHLESDRTDTLLLQWGGTVIAYFTGGGNRGYLTEKKKAIWRHRVFFP